MLPKEHLRGLLFAHRLRSVAVALTMALVATPAIVSLPAAAAEMPPSFADLAERLLPSVVNISTTQVIQSRDRPEIPQAPPGSPFEDFFREFFDRNAPERSRRATSLGSGFIVDSAGFVVTNNHVIAEADEISVILQDNERYEATVVGRDPKTDLALLKIDAGRDLPALEWGNSSVARVGDWVVAIGNPFGLGGSVTAGIISARQRDINAGPYDNFLQTDASINRGNSGGPLFNLDGQVIGVNTAIFSPTGGSVGIGFSIPSSLAERVVAQLRDFGRTKRGWLGVRIQTVTDEIAESLGLDSARGALVASVTEGGPAQDGKIEAGDVVLSFDNRPIDQMRELPRIVADTEIGGEVDVEVWRRGAMVDLRVTVGELEEDTAVLASVETGAVPEESQTGTIESLGLVLATLNDDLRLEHGVQDDAVGVLVTSIEEGGPAAEKGLRQGDLIMEVSQEEVRTPAQVAAQVAAAQEADRRSVLLLVNRNGELRFVAVRIESG